MRAILKYNDIEVGVLEDLGEHQDTKYARFTATIDISAGPTARRVHDFMAFNLKFNEALAKGRRPMIQVFANMIRSWNQIAGWSCRGNVCSISTAHQTSWRTTKSGSM